MGLAKAFLIIVAICLYAISLIDMIKIKKVLDNCIGKKVEDVMPEYNKFMNKVMIYIILASVISFIVIVLL